MSKIKGEPSGAWFVCREVSNSISKETYIWQYFVGAGNCLFHCYSGSYHARNELSVEKVYFRRIFFIAFITPNRFFWLNTNLIRRLDVINVSSSLHFLTNINTCNVLPTMYLELQMIYFPQGMYYMIMYGSEDFYEIQTREFCAYKGNLDFHWCTLWLPYYGSSDWWSWWQ